KIYTIMFFLVPFLLLPFYRFRWIILLLPFFILMFVTNDPWYQLPSIMSDQYSASLIPFLFLGTIEGLEKFKDHKITPEGRREPFKNILNKKVSRLSITIFVVIALLALFFQPFGPFNTFAQPNYNFEQEIKMNLTQYDVLNQLTNLIPDNDPYVLFQNNMPGVVLQDPSILPILEDFVFGFPYNLTYKLPNGTWTDRIDYVLADENSNTFYESGTAPYNLTMYDVLEKLYSTGQYGILAEEDGFVLLKHNYKGPIIYYKPEYEQIFPAQLLVLNNSYRAGNIITGTNPDGHRIWYGPYILLNPGEYQVTFRLSTTNNSASNSIVLWSGDYAQGETFYQSTLTGSSFPNTNTIYNITINISIDNFYDGVEFAGLDAYWNGSLSLYGITVKETAATPFK
ncbi:MAG: DUF2079 domain-containing protein, partial [Conexivisphaerales archaeon]